MQDRDMKLKFSGIEWKSKVSLKRATFSISINKLVAEGCCLEKSQKIYSYLAEDEKQNKRLTEFDLAENLIT